MFIIVIILQVNINNDFENDKSVLFIF
ncbi:hypothetical protein ACF7P6_07595, partial [Staphylococcus aureus]